ncbi:Uncharacterized phage protein gp47/JayE [Paenibacillus aquistagni]|uniref:Uncharacterized phage protein gp47/JayE n=2 Tax=Paenibacillus aquistagni TaxID=1852522 RepID=A0A1X7LWC2_9BACL|nr:Uncharacterized phage protein gp47/JayE [Paenibacillus aquistagni]
MDDMLAFLLSNVSDEYDKSEGYLVYDLLKSVAMLLTEQNAKIENVEQLINVDNLSGSLLEAFVSQRKGIVRTQATYAKGQLFALGNGEISKGDLFETKNGVQFEALETVAITGNGTVNIKSVKAGAIGNVPANQVTQMPVTISGITSVTNPNPITGGYEAESDESLRERYYIAIRTPPTSGNIYHYLQWAKEVSGVGDAKVFPVARGENTVEVVIIDQNKLPAPAELVQRVQEHIDPNSEGLGNGQAPIGAKCFVVAAEGLELKIDVVVTPESGYELDTVLENIKASITSYLKEIAFKVNYVSYAKIGEAIINAAGVEDYSGLTVNGGIANVQVGEKQVAILGGVTLG